MTWKLQAQSRIMWHDEELFRLRFSELIYIDGKATKRLLAQECFRANVQPLKGRELLLVPEHQRFLEQYWCFVPGKFFERQGQDGDIIRRFCQEPGVKDVHFQVQEIEYWGSYQKARITRVDVGDFQTP